MQLDLNRLLDATEAVLQSKGFTKSETPDLLINIIADQYEDVQRNSVGVGIGGGSYGGGVSVGAGFPLGGNKNSHFTQFKNIFIKLFGRGFLFSIEYRFIETRL